jgi:hypothetical protein
LLLLLPQSKDLVMQSSVPTASYYPLVDSDGGSARLRMNVCTTTSWPPTGGHGSDGREGTQHLLGLPSGQIPCKCMGDGTG